MFTIGNYINVEKIQNRAALSFDTSETFDEARPLVLSVGSLSPIKDRKTLINAFYIVRKKINAQLVVLGEGRERKSIENLVVKLGLEKDVFLPGFVDNPYKWMVKAGVLVSSSKTEGCPNNILEGLCLNIPIVATDCPGDTGAILEHGKWGKLVNVGDHEGMAKEILETLNNPNETKTRLRADEFAEDDITLSYLSVLSSKTVLNGP